MNCTRVAKLPHEPVSRRARWLIVTISWGALCCSSASCGTVVSGQPDAGAIDAPAADAAPADAPEPVDAALPIDAPIPCDMGDNNVIDPDTGVCYMLFLLSERWDTARLLCENLPGNAHLVSVTDDQENNLVRNMVGTRDVWIGGHDPTMSDSWEWLSGEPFVFEFWDGGEPDNSNELCIRSDGDRGGRWHDSSCSDRFPYICERR